MCDAGHENGFDGSRLLQTFEEEAALYVIHVEWSSACLITEHPLRNFILSLCEIFGLAFSLQRLQLVKQGIREIHSPDLVGLRLLDPTVCETATNNGEFPVEVDIWPLKAGNLPGSHAGMNGTQKQNEVVGEVVPGDFLAAALPSRVAQPLR